MYGSIKLMNYKNNIMFVELSFSSNNDNTNSFNLTIGGNRV
jgi:hypothetical protein